MPKTSLKLEYPVTVFLTEDLYNDFKLYCKRYDLNQSQVIRHAIRKHIGSNKL